MRNHKNNNIEQTAKWLSFAVYEIIGDSTPSFNCQIHWNRGERVLFATRRHIGERNRRMETLLEQLKQADQAYRRS